MSTMSRVQDAVSRALEAVQEADDVAWGAKITAEDVISAMSEDDEEAEKLWAWIVSQIAVCLADDGRMSIDGPLGWDGSINVEANFVLKPGEGGNNFQRYRLIDADD